MRFCVVKQAVDADKRHEQWHIVRYSLCEIPNDSPIKAHPKVMRSKRVKTRREGQGKYEDQPTQRKETGTDSCGKESYHSLHRSTRRKQRVNPQLDPPRACFTISCGMRPARNMSLSAGSYILYFFSNGGRKDLSYIALVEYTKERMGQQQSKEQMGQGHTKPWQQWPCFSTI